MKDKEFMKIVCEVKGIYPDGLTAMVDYGGLHLTLNKEEVIELASRLKEVPCDS